jgi:hypothetical protein
VFTGEIGGWLCLLPSPCCFIHMTLERDELSQGWHVASSETRVDKGNRKCGGLISLPSQTELRSGCRPIRIALLQTQVPSGNASSLKILQAETVLLVTNKQNSVPCHVLRPRTGIAVLFPLDKNKEDSQKH